MEKYHFQGEYIRVVIVGAGAAGLTLASNLRKNDEEIEIIVFTKSEDIAYSPLCYSISSRRMY